MSNSKASGALAVERLVFAPRGVALRPLEEEDFQYLYRNESGSRWRLRGATPSFPAYVDLLWRGVLCQFLAVESRTDTRLALFAAYNADLSNGHCYVLASKLASRAFDARVAHGLVVFIEHLFLNWPFRKLYFETDSLAASQFEGIRRRFLHEEGRLRSHFYYDGAYVDCLILSLGRDAWDDMKRGFA